MRTRQIIAALILAIGVVTSCTKFEQAGDTTDNIRISYNVVSPKPSVKSSAYPTSTPFVSYAWYLPNGKSWQTKADRDASQAYISSAEISYQDGKWYDSSTSYYWPKAGSLTFMSYSPAGIPNVSVDQNEGVKFSDWDVDANPTTDLMVADVAMDKTANETSGSFTGVPTIFRHKLASVVGFAFNTFHDYANGHDGTSGYANGDILFFIKSVSINKLQQKGTYTSGTMTGATRLGAWERDNASDERNYTWFTGFKEIRYSASEHEAVAANGLSGRDYLLVLPQTFSSPGSKKDFEVPNITIQYVKRTYSNSSDFSDETVTKSVSLYSVLGEHANRFDINKKITFRVTINIDSNLITWAPDYDEWTGSDYEMSI